jgi:hypothetical protein
MDAIKDYLNARTPIESSGLLAALDHLAAAGADIDALLTKAERVKALASREDVARFEQTAQTLGALSREVWIAHAATLTTINALKQLVDVEQALRG